MTPRKNFNGQFAALLQLYPAAQRTEHHLTWLGFPSNCILTFRERKIIIYIFDEKENRHHHTQKKNIDYNIMRCMQMRRNYERGFFFCFLRH